MDSLRERVRRLGPVACVSLSLFVAAGCATTADTAVDGGDTGDTGEPMAARAADDGLVCRNIRPIGSRISERVCMSAEQWERAAEADRDAIEETQRNASVGAGGE